MQYYTYPVYIFSWSTLIRFAQIHTQSYIHTHIPWDLKKLHLASYATNEKTHTLFDG